MSTNGDGDTDGRPSSLAGALLSPSRVGDVNRSRVLQAFCDHGPLSRAELAQMAGVTRATIGNIVQVLLEAGLVDEYAPRQGTGRVGKPARPLWFGPRAGLSAAVAVGAGRFEVALVNARGDLLEHDRGSFDTRASVVDITAAIGDALAGVLGGGSSDILGIGVAIPGVCDTERGEILGSGQVQGLAGTGLVDGLQDRFGQRVLVDNDSRVQALGEKWFGEGRGIPVFSSVQTGHGLSVGLVLNGVVHRGHRGQTGELGHTAVEPGGAKCRCGLRGCWETVATLGWLRKEAATRGVPGARHLDAGRLVAAAGALASAGELLDVYADNLAIGLATLLQLFGPHRLILHGDAVSGGEPFRARVAGRIAARVMPNLRKVDLVLSALDQQAGLLGAAGLVLSETFHLTS